MPLRYAGQVEEHLTVRRSAGIFDVSHMGQVRFSGPEAEAFLQAFLPGNIAALAPGASRYTQICNAAGGIVDDLIVTRLAPTEFFAVVNAARRGEDIKLLRQAAGAHGGGVDISDESDEWAMIALQGPEAPRILQELFPGRRWSDTTPFSFHQIEDADRLYVSRTGYTGETGAEILCPPDTAPDWWDRLLDAGALPCGLAARDSLRLEAGYCLYGQDLNECTTPVEAGLGWSVAWKKTEQWPGREKHERQRSQGPPRRLTGLRSEGRRPLRQGDEIRTESGETAGQVTSGGYSPVLECGIALGFVLAPHLKEERFQVVGRGKPSPVVKTRPPFVRTSLSK